VKWLTVWSDIRANFGVRQGSALSPFLSAVYLDDLAKLCNKKSCVKQRLCIMVVHSKKLKCYTNVSTLRVVYSTESAVMVLQVQHLNSAGCSLR